MLEESPEAWSDLVGQRFGRLTALGFAGARSSRGQKKIACACDCGAFIDVMPTSLRNGNTQSCGCLHSERASSAGKASATHGDARGGVVTYLYRAWQAILNRCLDPGDPRYRWYGARGIGVHRPWVESYATFRDEVLAAIGPRPSRAYSLDRIENDKGYEPGNLRWATAEEQTRNQRNVVRYDMDGESMTLGEWADRYGVPLQRVEQRVRKYGWPLLEALTAAPVGAGRHGPGEEDERERMRGVWYAMVARCHNPANERHADYGGRGIVVSEAWLASFDDFVRDVMAELGPRPSPLHTLDRIDNDKNYESGNMRWATPTQQNRHRRSTLVYELDGESRPLAEWAELAGQDYRLVKKRVGTYGWPLAEALGTPPGFGRCPAAERRAWKRP